MRQFETGATRDDDQDKYDYEGFYHPVVIERFGAYMHFHRKQADGNLRDSDNWQKGIPIPQYMKSLIRHTFTAWKLWRAKQTGAEFEDALCAILFNVQGILYELLVHTPPLQGDAADLTKEDAGEYMRKHWGTTTYRPKGYGYCPLHGIGRCDTLTCESISLKGGVK